LILNIFSVFGSMVRKYYFEILIIIKIELYLKCCV
jgi:hypothetical protein